jgi:16S rRNA (uracil1498-N3)-methyltransferase
MQRVTISSSQFLSEYENQRVILTPQQLHYLGRVLRLRDGDRFIVMDGKGKSWLAKLDNQQAYLLEELQSTTELPLSITLMMALPKGNGFDDIIRACTEIGVSYFLPVISDRTLLNPSPQKLQRWQRIAVEASEQSERIIVPTVFNPVSFTTAISQQTTAHCYICEARGDNYPHLSKLILNQDFSQTPEILIAIGPEGGWTQNELDLAIDSGFKVVSLGKRVFRAITAPIVAVSLIAAITEM